MSHALREAVCSLGLKSSHRKPQPGLTHYNCLFNYMVRICSNANWHFTDSSCFESEQVINSGHWLLLWSIHFWKGAFAGPATILIFHLRFISLWNPIFPLSLCPGQGSACQADEKGNYTVPAFPSSFLKNCRAAAAYLFLPSICMFCRWIDWPCHIQEGSEANQTKASRICQLNHPPSELLTAFSSPASLPLQS